MELEKLGSLLETTGYPVAYSFFPKAQEPPYICYLYIEDKTIFADGKPYFVTKVCNVELYTKVKDPIVEQTLETALASANINYHKSENLIQSEEVFQVLYEMEI